MKRLESLPANQIAIHTLKSAVDSLERGEDDNEAILAAAVYEAVAYHQVDRFSAKKLIAELTSAIQDVIQ